MRLGWSAEDRDIILIVVASMANKLFMVGSAESDSPDELCKL